MVLPWPVGHFLRYALEQGIRPFPGREHYLKEKRPKAKKNTYKHVFFVKSWDGAQCLLHHHLAGLCPATSPVSSRFASQRLCGVAKESDEFGEIVDWGWDKDRPRKLAQGAGEMRQ